jgi:membrane protein YdbS with pleckstrin-like domain
MKKSATDKNSKPTLESLTAERERYVTRIFWFALEIALIFLLPALAAIFIYKAVAPENSSWHVLPIAFVVSWVIVIKRYMTLHKKLSGLDADIKAMKTAAGEADKNSIN